MRERDLVMDANGASGNNICIDCATDWYPDWQPISDFPLVEARFSIFDADIQWLTTAGSRRAAPTSGSVPMTQ